MQTPSVTFGELVTGQRAASRQKTQQTTRERRRHPRAHIGAFVQCHVWTRLKSPSPVISKMTFDNGLQLLDLDWPLQESAETTRNEMRDGGGTRAGADGGDEQREARPAWRRRPAGSQESRGASLVSRKPATWKISSQCLQFLIWGPMLKGLQTSLFFVFLFFFFFF
jgi:hypothetical protein